MVKYKEPCGCVSDDAQWLTLCPEHFKLRENRLNEVKLDSLQWLMFHYDRFPNEDNLSHVVKRLAEVGASAKSRPAIIQWILKNATLIKRQANR